MREDNVIIFDPFSPLKKLAEEIKKAKEEERGKQNGLRTQED